MPNTFVTRFFIKGSKESIDKIVAKHFFQECKTRPKPLETCQMRSRNLTKDDLLEYVIVDSGEFEHKPGQIAFSTYFGWDVNTSLVQEMAKKLPPDISIQVVGFDYDDYPGDQALLLWVKGATGEIVQEKRVRSEYVAKIYFPKLFEELSKK